MKIELSTICQDVQLFQILCSHLDFFLCKSEEELSKIVQEELEYQNAIGPRLTYVLTMAGTALYIKNFQKERISEKEKEVV
jgi:hypothetical protein